MKRLFLLIGLVVFLTPMVVSANPNIVFCLTSSGYFYSEENSPVWGKAGPKCLSGNEITLKKYIELNPSFINTKIYKRHFEEKKEEISTTKKSDFENLPISNIYDSTFRLIKMDEEEYKDNCKWWIVANNKNNDTKKYDGFYKGNFNDKLGGRRKEVCISNHKVRIGRGTSLKGKVNSSGKYKVFSKGGGGVLIVGQIESDTIYVNEEGGMSRKQTKITRIRQNEAPGPIQDSQQDNQQAQQRSASQQEGNSNFNLLNKNKGIQGIPSPSDWGGQRIYNQSGWTAYGFQPPSSDPGLR